MMVMIGDTFHNFIDGVLIAAAFLADPQLGLVTALAIIAHEIPQEVGDFLVLLNSGFTKAQALTFNLASSAAMVLGGLLGYAALNELLEIVPYLLGFVAAGMIYVAVADLIPGLHRRPELKITLLQVSLMGLGVGSVWVMHEIAERSV
jgi:zinc and cadmium transporter